MRVRASLVVLLLFCVLLSARAARAAERITVNPGYQPAINFDAPDPDVVLAGTTYYAFTTGATWGGHIAVAKSSNPTTGWHTAVQRPAFSSAFMADFDHAPAAWQVNNTQNAPGVFNWGGRWIMYYAAQARSTKRWCLSFATASKPEGPYVDRTTKPWFCMDAAGGVTDPSPFVDSNGRAYLTWKTNTGAVFAPAQLWSAQLNDNGTKLVTFPAVLLMQRTDLYPWETTIENPQMFMRGATHYLLFSGNQWNSPKYAEGYAVCDGPQGPCARPQPIPFLTQYGSVVGPGGASEFLDTTGHAWLAYAAWHKGCTSYSCGGARKMYTTPLDFAGHSISCLPPKHPSGYRMVAVDGGIFDFGTMPYCGSSAAALPRRSISGFASTPDGGGYWQAATDGSVYAFGDARFFGAPGGAHAIGIAASAGGAGYWVAAANGSVFAYGSAHRLGSAYGHISAPIVAIAATPDGHGFWLAGRDGNVYAFGSAHKYDSLLGHHLNHPIVGIAAAGAGNGYWMVATDGGIFAFGSAAHYYGSMGGKHLNKPIVGMRPAPLGAGYWMVASDGGIFTFGPGAHYFGSTGGLRLNKPIIGMT